MEYGFTDFRVGFRGLIRGESCFALSCILLNLHTQVTHIFRNQKRKSVGLIRLGFGEAISFSPSVRFTLMHVYMNTRIK